MGAAEEVTKARWTAAWLLVALAVGILIGLFARPAPPPKPGGVLTLPKLPIEVASPAPAAKAEAAATAKTRITITRPVPNGAPYVAPQGAGPTPNAQLGPAPTPTGPDGTQGHLPPATGPYETIVIETESSGGGTATVVTPTPPPSPEPAGPGALGVSVGTFKGHVALSYRPIYVPIPLGPYGRADVGPSIILNTQMAGAAGTIALSKWSPHLYLEVGAAQEFQALPALKAVPFAGVGWRF
jgi:hypothetical protein